MNPKPTRERKACKRMKGKRDLEFAAYGVNEKRTHMKRAVCVSPTALRSFPKPTSFTLSTPVEWWQFSYPLTVEAQIHKLSFSEGTKLEPRSESRSMTATERC